MTLALQSIIHPSFYIILSSSLMPHVSPERKFGMPSTATFSLSEVLQIRASLEFHMAGESPTLAILDVLLYLGKS